MNDAKEPQDQDKRDKAAEPKSQPVRPPHTGKQFTGRGTEKKG